MKVTVREIQYRDVELTREQVDEITIHRLKTLTGGGEFLRERKGVLFVMKNDPDYRHGSIDEVIVREATPMDVKIFEVISFIKQQINNDNLQPTHPRQGDPTSL